MGWVTRALAFGSFVALGMGCSGDDNGAVGSGGHAGAGGQVSTSSGSGGSVGGSGGTNDAGNVGGGGTSMIDAATEQVDARGDAPLETTPSDDATDARSAADAFTSNEANPDVAVPYGPCPPKGTPCAIMPLGDDITQGMPDPAAGGYRARIFHLALVNMKSVSFVGSGADGPATIDGVAFPKAHEGHDGFTIDDSQFRMGISPLVPAAIATHKPNIVLLMVGTNDVDTGVSAIPDRLGALMDTILDADPKLLLVVAQVIPQQRATPLDQQVQTYNTAIPPLVKTRADAGKHVILVDMYTPIKSTPDYGNVLFADRLHPSRAGYDLIGDTWYAAIGPFLK
jgi:hypothetical protein